MAEAETEKEVLERAIRIIRNWRIAKNPAVVQLLFLELRALNREEHPELWSQLRTTLKENKDLHDEQLQFYIHEPELAKNGWWWYDKNLWK